MVDKVKMSCGYFGLVPDEMGRLLLAKRSDGRWNLPGGGVTDDDAKEGRSAQAVTAREVKEETGLCVVFADPRPVGEYATLRHDDIAVTHLCKITGGKLSPSPEAIILRFITPEEAMEMAKIGDVPYGLVGGLRTSSGKVPRHIQMLLHFFTRVGQNQAYRLAAEQYCEELGVPK